jgi:hypothetical protein
MEIAVANATRLKFYEYLAARWPNGQLNLLDLKITTRTFEDGSSKTQTGHLGLSQSNVNNNSVSAKARAMSGMLVGM